jgi:hypothetical protein
MWSADLSLDPSVDPRHIQVWRKKDGCSRKTNTVGSIRAPSNKNFVYPPKITSPAALSILNSNSTPLLCAAMTEERASDDGKGIQGADKSTLETFKNNGGLMCVEICAGGGKIRAIH